MNGIAFVLRTQRNFRIHLVAFVTVVFFAWFFEISLAEWLSVLLIAALVFSLEMVNTAIEKCIDLVSPEFHPLAKQAKDVAAGAVLLAAMFSVIVGIMVFGGRLLQFISDYL